MRTFAQKPKATQQATSPKTTVPSRSHMGHNHEVNSILYPKRTIGNRAVQRLLQSNAEERNAVLSATYSPHLGHGFSLISIRPPTVGKIQTKLAVNKAGDEYEQEADHVAEQVMKMREPKLQRACACGGACPKCKAEQLSQKGKRLQTKRVGVGHTEQVATPPIVHDVLQTPGQLLQPATRAFMETRFGHDFSQVRVHADAKASESARAVNALAYTVGRDVVFGAGQYAPDTTRGRRLLAHELAHVTQQLGAMAGRHPTSFERIQRKQAPASANASPSVTDPLSDDEWDMIRVWQAHGEVGVNDLTGDAAANALIVAEAIFCHRMLGQSFDGEDPLLCIDSDVTQSDPRVTTIAGHVAARGPIMNWTRVPRAQRILRVMELLIDTYGFPENGAAGLVGNLMAESGVLPTKIERAGARVQSDAPLAERTSAGAERVFSAEEVMNRNPPNVGPGRPGIGLAQWTSTNRRQGLFQHNFQGRQQGADILFNMDAQVDYLVSELQTRYAGVYNVITNAGVSVADASDEVVYRFETPGSVLAGGALLPRADPRVQAVFAARRTRSQRALRIYTEANQ